MSEWKEYKLGDCVEMQKGFAFKSSDYINHGIKIIKVSNLNQKRFDDDSCVFISPILAEQYSRYSLSEDDIIISTVGSWPSNPESVVGKVCRVPKIINGSLLNQNAVRLRVKKHFNQRFIYYILSSSNFSSYIANTAQGSANQASITLDDIRSYKFISPDIKGQEGIVSILNSLDDKIEINRRINEILEQQELALFKYFFVDLIPWGGIVPDSWKIGVLGDYLSESREKVGQREGVEEYSIGNNGIRKRSEIYNKSITSTPEKNKLLTQGCLAFGLGNKMITWGVMQDLIGSTSPAYTVYNVDPVVPTDYLLRFFAYYHASAKDLVKPTVRQGQALDKDVLLKKYFVLPSEDAWNSFYNLYNIYIGLFTTLKKQSIQLSQIRDTLLPKLMSGQIKVNEIAL